MTKITICKRFVSIVLTITCILTAVSIIPNSIANAEISESGVQEKINELASVYSEGTYFTSNGTPCYSCSSPGCCLGNIPSRTSADGSVVLPSGAQAQAVCGYAYSCCSFATYAFYYIFGYHFKKCPTVSLSEARLGDAVLMYSGYGPHYGIYMGQDSTYIYLYNSNGTSPLNNRVGYCQPFRKSSWSVSAIYRAPNYDAVNKVVIDETAPVISENAVSAATAEGFKVTCKVSEETEIGEVKIFAASPEKNAEFAMTAVSEENGVYTYEGFVKADAFGYASGNYAAKIIATDKAGNVTEAELGVSELPSYISKVEITNVSSKGYTVTCVLSETAGVSKVQFPTWSDKQGFDKLASDWQTNDKYLGTVTGNVVTYKVNYDNYDNALGIYKTHIYLFDANGNVMGKEDVSIDATEAVVETDLNSDGSYDIFDIMLSKVSDETEVDTDAVNETIMNKIMTKEA